MLGVMEIHRLLHITVNISEGFFLVMALHLNRWFGFWFSFGVKGLLKHLVLAESFFYCYLHFNTCENTPKCS